MITPHKWNLSIEEAKELQRELAGKVILEDQFDDIRFVAGVDMAINENNGMARAAIVLFSFPELTMLEKHVYEEPLRMDYIPGLLSFRELPALLGAFQQLKQKPDLVMADGQGIAHPRRLGIATHLGLLIDTPTIGCAKSILIGSHEPVGEKVGDWEPLFYKHEVIGAALRTRAKVKPMYISQGHKISLDSSIKYVLACGGGYRLPETTRQADKLSKDNDWRETIGEASE
ncbi:MAG TPA: deoxyribonuclease V [Ktedonobacteraceae bacterium]|jgi:deoxyribonuclease V|nr:deoxyribonuclease V [Ktedonobacteraceae bacterium]